MLLREFFEGYRSALERGDAAALAEAYDVPLTVIRPDRTVTVPDRERLTRELAKIVDTYLWAGMARLEMARFEEVGFEQSLGIVNVTWRPRDRAGAAITEVDTTYTVRGLPDGFRIATVTAHNEEERRLPLVRSAPRSRGR